jgi:hypothetical protein
MTITSGDRFGGGVMELCSQENTTVVGTAGTDLETISFVILVLEILGFLSQAGP